MKIIKTLKTLLAGFAIVLFAQAAVAETTLKLGTTGRLGMPIGDAIDQALMPALVKASGGKMKIEPFYQKSLCAEQNVVNKPIKDLYPFGLVLLQTMVISDQS